MFSRLLRIAVFTLFWSLLACLLVMIIVGTNNRIIFANPLFYLAIMALVIVLIAVLWISDTRISIDLFGAVGVPIDVTGRTRRDGLAVLAYVEQALRMNAPLSPILTAAAKTETGRLSRRLTNLKEMTDSGVDLSIALEQSVPEVSSRAIGLIAAAERTGQLQNELARILAEDKSPPLGADDQDSRFALAYVLMMVAAMTIILTLLIVFVEPRFRQIFHDFQIPMPMLNRWVFMTFSNVAPILGIIVLALIVSWIIYGIWVIISRSHAPRDLRSILNYFGSFLPWIGGSQRDRSWADVCRVLADGIAGGLPAETALEHLRELSLVPPVRSAVRRWNAQLQAGNALDEAARNAHLPKIITGMLRTAGDQSAAALEFLARYYASRFSRLRILLRGAVVPVTVLIFATCVAAIALSTFLPIVELINHMAQQVGTGK